MSAFAAAFEFVLRLEGGLVDNPSDPGGRTNLGITQATLHRARRTLPHLPRAVDDLTRDEAASIYRELYWIPNRCEEMPAAIALLHFDSAIQHAPPSPAMFLQHALGVKVDGVIGPKTIAALNRVVRWEPVLDEYVARRAVHYGELSHFPVFGLGWMRRLKRVDRAANALL